MSRAGEEPPYLVVGTDVSAKYKGAFCEAKVKKVNRNVKCKVTFKNNLGIVIVSHDNVKGTLRVGAHVEVKHPDKNQFFEAVINKLNDQSQYTVVFDDGDETTLRRNSLCLKSGRHFAESETLDQLPLTHPEHFGTPVIGSKGRKRRSLNRSTNDEGSSDEDLPPKKKESKQREPDPDVGKVVCVEVGDKKKTKDNWFPALVVSPSAQESVKVNTKEDYLVRSFKDGKYFSVVKKETRPFTREIGSKVDNNTLKTAVEKASQYTDRDELPPHWDREILFGLNDASDDGDSNEDSDSDSSDDEPSEEKDRFVAQLYKFMDDRGTPINKAPTVSNRDLNLCKLFKVVQKMGGYNRVTNHMQWKTVYTKMGLPGYNTSSSHQIKQAYKKYLHSFEDFYRKLGCTMGTSTRSGRMRHRSGRCFLPIRDRDREFKAAGRRKQENKKKHEKNTKEEESSKSEDNKEESKTKNEKPEPEVPENNEEPPPEPQPSEKSKSKEEKKNKIKKEKGSSEKKNKSDKDKDKEKDKDKDKDEKHLKIKGRKKSTKDEEAGEEHKTPDSSFGSETLTDIDINVGDKVKVKYGKGRHQKIYEAKVLEVEEEDGDKHFYVHYTGWNMRYDEWVKRHRIVENLSQKARKGRSATSAKNLAAKQSGGKRGRPPSVFGKASLQMAKKSLTSASASPRSRSTRSDKNSLADSPFVNGLEPRKRMRKSSGHTDHSNDCSKESHDENSDDDSDSDSQQPSIEVKEEQLSPSGEKEFSDLATNEDGVFEQFGSSSQEMFSKPSQKGRKIKKETELFLNVEDEDVDDGDVEDAGDDEDEEEMNFDDDMNNESVSSLPPVKIKSSESVKKTKKLLKKEKKEEEASESKKKKKSKKSKEIVVDNDVKSDSNTEIPSSKDEEEDNIDIVDDDLRLNTEQMGGSGSLAKKSDEESYDDKEFDKGLKVKKKVKQKLKRESSPCVSIPLQALNEPPEEVKSNSYFLESNVEKFEAEKNETAENLDIDSNTSNNNNNKNNVQNLQTKYDEPVLTQKIEMDDDDDDDNDDRLKIKTEAFKEETSEENVSDNTNIVEESPKSELPLSCPDINDDTATSKENFDKHDDLEECPAPVLVNSVSEVQEFNEPEETALELDKYDVHEEGKEKPLEEPEKIPPFEEKDDLAEEDTEHKSVRTKKKLKGKKEKENEDESTELSEAESDSKKIKSRSGKGSKSKKLKLPFNDSEADTVNPEPVLFIFQDPVKAVEQDQKTETVSSNDDTLNTSTEQESDSPTTSLILPELKSNNSSPLVEEDTKFSEIIPSSLHSLHPIASEVSDSSTQPLFIYEEHRSKSSEKEKKHHKAEVFTEKKEASILAESPAKISIPTIPVEEKTITCKKDVLYIWDEKGNETEITKQEEVKKKSKDDDKKKTDKAKDEEKKPKESKQKKSKEKKSKSKRDDSTCKADKEFGKDSDKKDSEKTKKKESKKKRDSEKRKLDKYESDLESLDNSELFRKKEKKRKSKQEDRKKDGETVKKKSKKKGFKEHEKLSDEDLKEMRESKKAGKKSEKLGKSKKKKDKSKKESQGDDHEGGGKNKSDKEHGKKTEKRLKAESLKQTIEKIVTPVKEEPEYDDVTNLLLCREDVPMSPVAGDSNQSCKQELEIVLPTLIADNQYLSRTSEDSAPLPVSSSTPYNTTASGICENESSSQSFFKNDQESSMVLDNTPPTTPESAISTMSGSIHECDSISPGQDEESTKSGQESLNYMDLEQFDNVNRLVCHEHVDFAQSEAALVLGSLGVQGFDKRQALMSCTAMPTKRSRTDYEELTPKKKKKSRRRSHSASEVGKSTNSPRHKHSSCKLSKTTASDSDETSPSDQLHSGFQTHASHSSSVNSNISSNSSYAGSDREVGLNPPALRSPRPSKFNFYVELDDYSDGAERIAILQEKMTELRKTYMALKAEVACIDRRRKKLRKKEKEGIATTSNVVEVELS